ncbi:MAG: type 4a pilus biogenesis protein PilO [Clostridiales bacterium]|nr:type 4a pilus biogenesis protein PilO [Clostridiales bacterium]
MKKNVSMREMILLGILLIALVYYFAIHRPLTAQMAELATQQTEVQTQLDATTQKAIEMKAMEKKLDELKSASGGVLKGLPQYNNLNAVLLELNTILSASSTYTINFDDEVFMTDGYTVSRSFSLNFQTVSYDAAINILNQIKSSNYRYLLQDMNLSTGSTTGAGCTVSVDLTCFEYKT